MTARILSAGAALFAVTGLALSVPCQAQETLGKVKELYASAAYEDALAAVGDLDATAPKPEVEQYRVFCLVALGRSDEAETAVEAIVNADPSFVPDSTAASPRILDLFKAARLKIVPGVARRIYVEAKTAMDGHEREQAIAKFSEVLSITDDDDLRKVETVSELRLLADGFLQLVKAEPAPVPAPSPAAPSSTDAPAASAKSPQVTPPQVTPPVPINEALPPWHREDASASTTFTGAIRVVIGADGKVTAVELTRSVHPLYDQSLVDAARGWTYKPATRDGVPIPSEKVVQVTLRPRE